MIRNIIFDFGDVFINLDKAGALQNTRDLLGIKEFSPKMIHINEQYEMGLISSDEFLKFYETEFPNLNQQKIINLWNSLLKDFPKKRLHFLKEVNKKYRCFLLSNTNELHINWIKKDWGIELYNEFKSCFEEFYLSHEMNLRKPNADIFEFVLTKHQLNPKETLFIDDTKENTATAKKLGIHIWTINPETDDVIELFTTKKTLFK